MERFSSADRRSNIDEIRLNRDDTKQYSLTAHPKLLPHLRKTFWSFSQEPRPPRMVKLEIVTRLPTTCYHGTPKAIIHPPLMKTCPLISRDIVNFWQLNLNGEDPLRKTRFPEEGELLISFQHKHYKAMFDKSNLHFDELENIHFYLLNIVVPSGSEGFFTHIQVILDNENKVDKLFMIEVPKKPKTASEMMEQNIEEIYRSKRNSETLLQEPLSKKPRANPKEQ